MKILKLITILLLVSPLLTFAQWKTGFMEIHYPLKDQNVEDIYLAYDNTFYATVKTEYHCIIYKSLDQGYSWEEFKRFEDIDHLFFINSFSHEFKKTNPVWISTGEKISYDLGNSWNDVGYNLGSYSRFLFCDQQQGWEIEGWYPTLKKTIDGGKSWNREIEFDYRFEIKQLFFIDNSSGYLLGYNNYWPADDSSCLWEFRENSWKELSALKIKGRSDSLIVKDTELTCIEFIDEQNGWLSYRNEDGNKLIRTKDGGETWEDISCNYHFIFDMRFLDENEGWALSMCKDIGKLIHTTNGGIDWYAYNDVYADPNDKLEITGNFGWINKWHIKKTYNPYNSEQSFLELSSFYYIYNESLGTRLNNTRLNDQPVFFPNPFSDQTQIRLPNNKDISRIEIIDVTGKTMQSINNIHQKTYRLNRNHLRSGIYFLKVYGDKEYLGRAVIK